MNVGMRVISFEFIELFRLSQIDMSTPTIVQFIWILSLLISLRCSTCDCVYDRQPNGQMHFKRDYISLCSAQSAALSAAGFGSIFQLTQHKIALLCGHENDENKREQFLCGLKLSLCVFSRRPLSAHALYGMSGQRKRRLEIKKNERQQFSILLLLHFLYGSIVILYQMRGQRNHR